MSSKARAARRRQDRYAEQGKLDPARLYELNARRRLPGDHPSADNHETGRSGVHIWGDTAEGGSPPAGTDNHNRRRRPAHVSVRGQHRGLQTHRQGPARPSGRTARAVYPDDPHSYAARCSAPRQLQADRVLPPSVPKRVARKVAEIAVDATDYQTWARTTDFSSQSEVNAGRIPSETILKPNGKIQHTKDDEAGTGWRSATSKHPAGSFNGYSAHLAVAIRALIGGKRQQPVPPYIVSMVLTPADVEAGPIGYQVTVKAKQLAPRLKVVKADQHYTAKKTTFVRPLREHGWDLVMNQSVDEQQIVRLITVGKHNTPLIVHCGTPLTHWTPKHLHTPPDGRKKLICPQCAGKAKSTAKTYNPKRANRVKGSSDLPVPAVTDRETCCDGMINLGVDELDNYQRNAYGTTKWATDYAGRNPVEGVNSMIKDDGSFEKDSCRAFGLAAHTLAALAAAVIHNLKQTRRTRNPEKDNPTTTTPPTQSTPTRAPP